MTAGGEPVFKSTGSFREPAEQTANDSGLSEIEGRNEVIRNQTPAERTPPPARIVSTRLSNSEIEKKLARLHDELDDLEEEARELRLRSPQSPYSGFVELGIGNARSTDPEREYVTLTARSSNNAPINISDWYLESYVSEERAALPEGARNMDRFRTTHTEPIRLEPGERAYILTSDPPFNVSFHENQCTGYLIDLADIYPTLRRSCPRPIDELEEFSRIQYDNDACYDFVERISRCEIIDEDEIEGADISRACELFVRDELAYDGCVENHQYDPLFDNIGYWRVYLSRERSDTDDEDDADEDKTLDLWRKEREILRLIDENDRVIDVIEY
jgi:hypothetical protein